MSSSIVYFAELPKSSSLEQRVRATGAILEAFGLESVVSRKDRTAIKIHVGEKHNTTHVAPAIVRVVVDRVKKAGASPFLTETSTLYKGERNNAVDHLRHAFAHGFTYEAIGAPFIMADGLVGTSEAEVPIPGLLFDKVAIAREVLLADSLVAVTHATGHLGNGLAAAVKNLGMGLASRMGKLRQHSALKPKVDPKACTFCGKCLKWCPVEAVEERGGKAFIVSERCIGCGECLAVCRFDAVRHDWSSDLAQLQRREAEHALGAVQDKRGKLLVLSYLVDMTKNCDCQNTRQPRLQPDVGILASRDPVAIDQAALDLTKERFGKSLAEVGWPEVDPTVQLEHGEKIGLGSRKYELQRVEG
jgi:uncharacterized Fe-S center protein